jgi:hypothetical protein
VASERIHSWARETSFTEPLLRDDQAKAYLQDSEMKNGKVKDHSS